MYPAIGFDKKIQERFQGDWEKVFDVAVYLSKAIRKQIERPYILSQIDGWQSNEKEMGIDLEKIIEERAVTEEELEKEKEGLTTEREKLRNSLDATVDSFDKKSRVVQALTSIWKKIINGSKALRTIRNFGRKIYQKLIQRILPFDFDSEGLFEKNNRDETTFLNTRLIKALNEDLKKNMRKIIQKELR
ncbi:MAG: hypothetical protein V5A66_02470 [Candidatus Thermoplasmatota archaeon]